MAEKLAIFTLGFALGMTTMLGIGVHAAKRVTAEASSTIERATANVLVQAQVMLSKLGQQQQQRRSSTRSSDDAQPAGGRQMIDGE